MTDISKRAKIIKIEPQSLTVEIENQNACGTCALKGRCGTGECKNQVCRLIMLETSSYQIGENVKLVISETNGFMAVVWSCILPLLLMVSVLLALLHFGYGEIESGIYSIIILIPYYFGLSLLHKFLQKKLPIRIERQLEN